MPGKDVSRPYTPLARGHLALAAALAVALAACGGAPEPESPPADPVTAAPPAPRAPPRGGLMPEQIRETVHTNTRKLVACYPQELGFRTITVGWVIAPDGHVTESFVVKSTGDAAFDGCVADAVRSFVYPTATTPTRVSQYPFKFGVVRDGGT